MVLKCVFNYVLAYYKNNYTLKSNANSMRSA